MKQQLENGKSCEQNNSVTIHRVKICASLEYQIIAPPPHLLIYEFSSMIFSVKL